MGGLIDALGDFFDNSSVIVDLGRLINLAYFPPEYPLIIVVSYLFCWNCLLFLTKLVMLRKYKAVLWLWVLSLAG